MKRFIIISSACCILVIIVFWFTLSYSWVKIIKDSDILDDSHPGKVIDKQTASEIHAWLDTNRTGWSPSLVTYVPLDFICGKGFLLQVKEDFLVMNYDGCLGPRRLIQIEKSFSPEDKIFWKRIINKTHSK